MNAMKSLPSGPARISHSGPGLPYMDLWKGALGIVKANLIASLACAAPQALMVVLYVSGMVVMNVVSVSVGGILLSVGGLIGLLGGLAAPLLLTNYMRAVKEFQASGKPIGIGDLLKFDNIVNRYLCVFVVGLSAICCYIPPLLLNWAIPIVVDKPATPFMTAIKGALPFGKKNIVPFLIFAIIGGVLISVMNILCFAGSFIGMPLFAAAHWLAYELKRDEITADAAAGGITL